MRKIVIVGAGYVGLVTGPCFAKKDNFVIVVERDSKKIDALLNGKVPFYEPGLDSLVFWAIENKKIVFVNNVQAALQQNPEIIFSCVGTPSMPDGSADLSAIFAVAEEVGKSLDDYCLFINKSTVPVGTAKKVENIISEQLKNRNIEVEFDVASNPEFLKEGSALDDFLIPDRVVVGVKTKKAENILRQLYKPFLKDKSQFLVMNSASSELTKYASNSMLATRISFMNQLALLADNVGADIADVRLGMSKDVRIGPSFLNAGIGYGGSCFPKDVKALTFMGKEYNLPMTLINSVDQINDDQRVWFANEILNYYGDKIIQKHVGIWGLAFKPETDDIRCAPSIDIIKKLLGKNVKITVYDPVAMENIKNIFGDKINFAKTSQEVLAKTDFLLILTEWKEFFKYGPKDFYQLKDKVVFDGRNCFDPLVMCNNGIKYFTVGRNSLGNNKEKFVFDFESKFNENQI